MWWSRLLLAWPLMCLIALCSFIGSIRGMFGSSPRAHMSLNRSYFASYLLFLLAFIGLNWVKNWALQSGGYFIDPVLDPFWFLVKYASYLLPIVLLFVLGHVMLHRASVLRCFDIVCDEQGGAGDRLIESIRTGGTDNDYRRSWIQSALLVFLMIFGGLFLNMFGGCERYPIPDGGGSPAAPPTVVKKVVEEEKEVLIIAQQSPIVFQRAKIEDSEVFEEIMEQSENEVETSMNGQPGPLGEGEGDKAGWPSDLDGKLQFLRIKHRGSGWDDGMTEATGNADRNFMVKLGEASKLGC